MKLRLLSLGLLHVALTTSSSGADIAALVIGNDQYVRAEDQLDTPVADAELMKRTLEALPGGADVKILRNATKEDIEIALNGLKSRAQGAKLALVFYSGHGTEDQPDGFAQNETFLLPIDAIIPDVNFLPTRAVSLSTVLSALKAAPVTARAVILDCCRSGAPRALGALAGKTKNFGDIDERVKSALGKAVIPDATLIAFASSPGRKAAAFLKESDENSPFTKFITEELATGSGDLRKLIGDAAFTTEQRTQRLQVPYVTYNGAESAIRQITFRASPAVPASPVMTEAEIERRAVERAKEIAAKMAAEAAAGNRQSPMGNKPTAIANSPSSIGNRPSPLSPSEGSTALDQGTAGQVIQIQLPGGQVMKFCYCPPGSFTMGSPVSEKDRGDDEDQVQVRISKGFWLAQTECTQAQWQAVMGSSIQEQAKLGSYGKNLSGTGAELPMYYVSHEEAESFCEKLQGSATLPAGWKLALPSEAQWEYACRAGSPSAFSGPLEKLAWYSDNSDSTTHAVAGKQPNAWGLYDIHGNVWEWCADAYDKKLLGGTDPRGMNGANRVLRGGSWYCGAANCRAALRDGDGPGNRYDGLGFRPALVPSR